MSNPTLNDEEALLQLADYPQEMCDLYRIYRQRNEMSPNEALREVVTYCAKVGKEMIASGMPDAEWED